jgi:hypothetical protein
MQHYILTGERATWPKLCRISNQFRIERNLIECNRVLEREAMRVGLPAPSKEIVSHSNAAVRMGQGIKVPEIHQRAAGGDALLLSSPLPPNESSINGLDQSPISATEELLKKAAQVIRATTGMSSNIESAVTDPTSSLTDSNSGNGHSHRSRREHRHKQHGIAASSRVIGEDIAASGLSVPNSANSSRSASRKRRSQRTALGGGNGSSGEDSSSSGARDSDRGPSASPTFDTEQIDDDVLVSKGDHLRSGEITNSLTAAILAAELRPKPPTDSFNSQEQPLWKRGMDTDTDNTDTEFDERDHHDSNINQ